MAWDVLSRVSNLYGMFCLGWPKLAWNILSSILKIYNFRGGGGGGGEIAYRPLINSEMEPFKISK